MFCAWKKTLICELSNFSSDIEIFIQMHFIAESLAVYVVHFLSPIAGISDCSNVPTSR